MTPALSLTSDAPVTASSHQTRACIAALLLVLQVLGLGHVALARHEVSETGAIVDVQPVLFDSHADDEDHLCADDVAIHADAQGDCLVLVNWASPRVEGPVASAVVARLELETARPLRAPMVSSPREVLARAPKGSPPRS